MILHEINFGGSKSSKNAVFAYLVPLKFGMVNLGLLKVQKLNSEPLNVVKWQILIVLIG